MTDIREVSEIVSEYMQDLKEDGEFYSGFIDGKEAYETFFLHLRASGYWFVVKSSSATANDHANKGAVFFQNVRKGSNLQIPFFGALYEHVKNSHFECCQGLKRSHDPTNKSDPPPWKKRRFRFVPSKKIGCSATMTVWHIFVYPEYKIDKYNAHGSEEQTKLARKLKTALAARNESDAPPDSGPVKYDRFVIRLSMSDVHNHPTLSCLVSQTLHPELMEEIASMVKKENCSAQGIQKHLAEYVRKKVRESLWPPPERANRCFYPKRSTIFNHIHKTVYALKEKKLDQEVLEQYIIDCIPPNNSIYFRPYRVMGRESSNTCSETQPPLLLCHQTSWQKHLLNRYGDNICVLDTYKTTVYNLPLFFLVVKTNVGYSVAGTFITHSVSSELIQDALKVFLTWNPDWDPLYFITDLSKPQIKAIKSTFTETAVYIGAYYREQAWDRWLGHRDSELPANAQISFKRQWKEIACSKTVSEFEENVLIMKNSYEFSRHSLVQKYMDKVWLPEAQRWVQAFHAEDFLIKVNVMNGIDSQSQELNHEFLKQNADKTLSELVNLVLMDYLPTVLDKYRSAQLLNRYMPLREDCPEFLEDRTLHFVKHVMQRYTTAMAKYSPYNIDIVAESRFIVAAAEARSTRYVVDLDEPSCTCSDFVRWHFPCTHLCAIFLYVPGRSFDTLPKAYLTSPYLTVDDKLYQFNSSEQIPTYDNTVTIPKVEAIEPIEPSDDSEPDGIDTDSCIGVTIPVEVKQGKSEGVEKVRELLKELFEQTFLFEGNMQCLQSATAKLLAVKLLLAEGIPEFTEEPPPLTRIITTAEDQTNKPSQCKRPLEGSAHVAKKVKIPDARSDSVALTANITLAQESRKIPSNRTAELTSKKVKIPYLRVAAFARTGSEVVKETSLLPTSNVMDETKIVKLVDEGRLDNQSFRKLSRMPPLLIRKGAVLNKTWVHLASKRYRTESAGRHNPVEASNLECSTDIPVESGRTTCAGVAS